MSILGRSSFRFSLPSWSTLTMLHGASASNSSSISTRLVVRDQDVVQDVESVVALGYVLRRAAAR